MASAMRRWDGDTRGDGIADGAWLAGEVRQLLDALGVPNWVAEDPDLHLLPHLQRACEEPGTPWTLRAAAMEDAVYVVSLEWTGTPARMGQVRADAFALLGKIAESVSYVHQRVLEDVIAYDAATGFLAADTPFRPHGHLVQLRIVGPAVAAICAGTRPRPNGDR